MVFSSNLFLFLFLPVFLAIYFGSPARARNAILLAASLLFYAFGSGIGAWILIASVFFNDAVARLLTGPGPHLRKALLIGAVAINLLPLFYYKYFASSVGSLTGLGVHPPIDPQLYSGIELPIGISFFTFQAISYIADVYMRVVPPARTTLEFATYHTLFPQLIAGPIVRYVEIAESVRSRQFRLDQAAEGAYRFCIGLAKKVILADNLAVVVDQVFSSPRQELSAPICWFAMACFSLQIYLDFSGYSDMAIGLGRILGFQFPENFDQPYRAQSITEFWRRWHMTLTRWFRDYVYVPLGGNRKGSARTYINLWLVFLLCGLWHGAALTFVIWGLYHGALLVIERLLKNLLGWAPRGIPGVITTVVLVTIGWVPFRATSVDGAANFLATMFGVHTPSGVVYYPLTYYLTPINLTYFTVGLMVALFPIERLRAVPVAGPGLRALYWTGALACLLVSIIMLSANSFRPFIYFQF